MNRAKIGLVFIGLILAGSTVQAATISGIVYDGLTLEPQSNSILTIDTSPIQTKVSKDGSYVFTVEDGNYLLEAEYRENGIATQRAQREVFIEGDGNYIIDIILLPEVGSVPDEPLPGEENPPSILDQLKEPAVWLSALAIILAAAGYSIWNIRRSTRKHSKEKIDIPHVEANEKIEKPKEEIEEKSEAVLDQYAKEVIGHLKRGGNRLTQKELRGMMKIGEAKVSLVVSELEEEKIIKKIKRGRGNILVLTEKGIHYDEKNEPVLN